MSKLAVIFPGIGYTADRPLLHYAGRIARENGYEVMILNYTGFPAKVRGDRSKMVESYQIALKQAEEMLSAVDPGAYDDVLFIGKSIGTIVAAKIASESSAKENIRQIMYTPLEDTFSFTTGDAVVFTGTDDPWVGGEKSRISGMCADRGIPCTQVSGANHSLETNDTDLDIKNLYGIMKETERFILGK